MNRQRYVSVVTAFIALALLAGCHGNQSAWKQRYMDSAKRFSAEGRYREAAIQYLNALRIDISNPDAHYGLSQAYEHLGRLDSARSELTRTIDLQPDNYPARVELGNLLFAAGRTDEAQAQANAVLRVQPNNPDLQALLSAIAVRQGQKDKALIELSRALALDPNRAAFHEDLALLLDADPANAPSVEHELKKAVELDPKSVNAKLLLSNFYSRSNRLQEAEKNSWQAVATDPKSLAVRENVAQVILMQGDPARAEQALRQASQDLAADPQGVRVLADYYTNSGQLDKATAEFSSLAAKYPKNTSVQKGYVHILLKVKDYTTARAILPKLMKISPRDPEVAALSGIMSFYEGDPDKAVTTLEENARSFPTDATIPYWLGKAALAKGDSALAEKSFRRVSELNPSDLETQKEMVRIACLRGDMGLMADIANQTIAAVPHFPGGYLWRATAERIRNSPDLAEADLKTAINLAPQSPHAYLQLGELCFAQKRFPEGVSMFEQALLYDPNSVSSLQMLIGYDLSRKQPEKAISRLKVQIEKSPGNSRFYDLLAQLQIQNKNLDQAAASAAKAIQLNPRDGEAVMRFVQIAARRGKTADVVGTWEQWSNAHPNDADAFAILGTLEESRGDLAKSVAYYKKALQIQPQQPVAANNLAYRMLLNGETLDTALTLAQTARQGMPDSPGTEDTLAWAYYCKGNYEFARDLLEDAIITNPDNATMQYHLGMVYSKLQDKSTAAIHLNKTISLAHDSPAAKDAQTALKILR